MIYHHFSGSKPSAEAQIHWHHKTTKSDPCIASCLCKKLEFRWHYGVPDPHAYRLIFEYFAQARAPYTAFWNINISGFYWKNRYQLIHYVQRRIEITLPHRVTFIKKAAIIHQYSLQLLRASAPAAISLCSACSCAGPILVINQDIKLW